MAAIVTFLKTLKGDTVVEPTAIEFRDGSGEYERGAIVVVDAGNANNLLRIVNPLRDLQRRAGRDTTVLLRIGDDERQNDLLERGEWPRDRIPRFDIGRLPDWPDE